MPELTITIGERDFTVGCQEGEEHYLNAAAQMLNVEAEALLLQAGRLPEARMLLMAGLMLADKTAAAEDELAEVRKRVTQLEAEVARLKAEPETVEVPVIPQVVTDTMAEIAARAEALAEHVEERAQG